MQHRFLNALRCDRATLFLRPQIYHEDIIRLRLLPQFCELNPNATFSKVSYTLGYYYQLSGNLLVSYSTTVFGEMNHVRFKVTLYYLAL